MDIFLCGMITACNWVAAVIFLRFWRVTRDRLFLYFAIAFFVFGLTRMPRALIDPATSPYAIYPYIVRFVSYALILTAIVEKNLPGRRRASAVGLPTTDPPRAPSPDP